MTAKRLLVMLLLMSACAYAQGPFTLAGRLDVPSIMKLSEKAGKLADKASPGSSGKVVLATLGVTMNPQLADFDLSLPFSILIYSNASGGKEPWSACAIVGKKRKKVPQMGKFGAVELFVADFGERACLCTSKALADSLKAEPERPSGMDASADLSLWLDVQAAAKAAQIPSLLMSEIYGLGASSQVPGEAEIQDMKATNIRLQYLDKLLRQLSNLTLSISLLEDKALLKLSAKPLPGSGLESFIAAQRPASLPDAVQMPDASLFGVASLRPDPELKAQLSAMFREIALETCSDEKAAAVHSEILGAIFKGATGEAAACFKNKGGYAAKFVLSCSQESIPEIEAALQKRPEAKTETPKLWLLNSWNSGKDKLYCLLRKEGGCGVSLLFGREDMAVARSLLSGEAKAQLPAERPEGASILLAKAKAGEPGSGIEPFCALSFKDGRLDLSLTVSSKDFESSLGELQGDAIPK